jgi:hypothetical protein
MRLMAIAFAGPLSRFFAADASAAVTLRAAVEAWRRDFREAVAERLREALTWDETAEVEFAVDLGSSGWSALCLFALYAERPELELPDTVPPLLELDGHWRTAAAEKFQKSCYGHLLPCRAWLPGAFAATLRAPLPDGEAAEIGALARLADQLRWLNQRTFQADAPEVAMWRGLPAEVGGDLISAARRGYAGMLAAAEVAQRHGVPLLLRGA